MCDLNNYTGFVLISFMFLVLLTNPQMLIDLLQIPKGSISNTYLREAASTHLNVSTLI